MRALIVTVAVSLLAVSVVGCGGDDASDTVTGVVTQVTGQLAEVDSFVITDTDGKSHRFVPAEGLRFHDGPLDHLREHIITGTPVVVVFERGADGALVAVSVEDVD